MEGPDRQSLRVVPGFQLLAEELLAWGEADLISAKELETQPQVVLWEYHETLRPTHGVPKFEGAAEGSIATTQLQALAPGRRGVFR